MTQHTAGQPPLYKGGVLVLLCVLWTGECESELYLSRWILPLKEEP